MRTVMRMGQGLGTERIEQFLCLLKFRVRHIFHQLETVARLRSGDLVVVVIFLPQNEGFHFVILALNKVIHVHFHCS
jgi:hypothetical protein